MTRNKKRKLTEWILGQDSMVSLQRLRFSLIVNSLHTEHILLPLLQSRDIHVGVLVTKKSSLEFPFLILVMLLLTVCLFLLLLLLLLFSLLHYSLNISFSVPFL